MRLVALVTVTVMSACLSTPTRPADNRSDAGGDARGDGAGSDGSTTAPVCATGSPVLFDDFNGPATTDGATACAHGGSPIRSGTGAVSRGNGVLKFDVASSGGGAYCNWNPFPTHDVIVKLSSVPIASYQAASDVDIAPPDAPGSTYMQVVGGVPVDLKLVQDSTEIARIDWTASLVWWRYRITGAKTLSTDYSSDGVHWTLLGDTTWAQGVTSLMELTVGLTDATASTFTVDEIYTCQ